ncbi:DUF4242 domain-containing protein [Leptonema illini]|uniref:DUF4242 domain-containing protein n=1 Tax=Leptonema illini DSM 21528 TaxID=929563 RepID=H2CG25_9LEPT|nr:DUF4242 domain-containing protein [Leptonema illini]EHQ07873.1 hypothetical protein Lepil_3211 [Leptonema illini DSM 21528]
MKLFIDTHDKNKETFPAQISPEQLSEFYANYRKIFAEEGVVIVRTFLGLGEGRAFCLNLAKSTDDVKRAHDRVGLPYDSITEVTGVSPNDLLLNL